MKRIRPKKSSTRKQRHSFQSSTNSQEITGRSRETPRALRSVLHPLERLRFTFTPNRKREFVPRDQVSPLFFVYCSLLLHKNKKFYASFIHKNRFGLFLSAYFLFWEILNSRLPFAVRRKRESYSLYYFQAPATQGMPEAILWLLVLRFYGLGLADISSRYFSPIQNKTKTNREFTTLEKRRELEPKCVPQLFLGSLLWTHRSAIGHSNSPRSLCES